MQKKMIGTTGTTFTVVASTPAGDLGFRDLGDGSFRIRLAEYIDQDDINLDTFENHPEEENVRTRRFSTVRVGLEGLGEAIAEGVTALVKASQDVDVDKLAEQVAEARAAYEAAQARYNSAVAYA